MQVLIVMRIYALSVRTVTGIFYHFVILRAADNFGAKT